MSLNVINYRGNVHSPEFYCGSALQNFILTRDGGKPEPPPK